MGARKEAAARLGVAVSKGPHDPAERQLTAERSSFCRDPALVHSRTGGLFVLAAAAAAAGDRRGWWVRRNFLARSHRSGADQESEARDPLRSGIGDVSPNSGYPGGGYGVLFFIVFSQLSDLVGLTSVVRSVRLLTGEKDMDDSGG